MPVISTHLAPEPRLAAPGWVQLVEELVAALRLVELADRLGAGNSGAAGWPDSVAALAGFRWSWGVS